MRKYISEVRTNLAFVFTFKPNTTSLTLKSDLESSPNFFVFKLNQFPRLVDYEHWFWRARKKDGKIWLRKTGLNNHGFDYRTTVFGGLNLRIIIKQFLLPTVDWKLCVFVLKLIENRPFSTEFDWNETKKANL